MSAAPPISKAALIPGIALVAASKLLIRAGVARRTDGWRRAAGLVLRGEESTFVLSAFGLDAWSDGPSQRSADLHCAQSHVAARLAAQLRGEPAAHIRVTKGEFEDRIETTSGPAYTLAHDPWVEGPGRFVPPTAWNGETATALPPNATPLVNFVCRISHDGECDVWARFNHVGIDGVPAQAILTRLESTWGVPRSVHFPSTQSFAPFTIPRTCPGRPDLGEVQTFLNFEPLLKWRKGQNAHLPEPMTVGAALLWRMAHHEVFRGLHAGSTVEVPEVQGIPAGVGVVVIRASDYTDKPDGLARFVKDFNRQIERTRSRASPSMRTLDAAARIPASLAANLIRFGLSSDPRAFGEVALTMLRDAKVFGAPLADTGHTRGFLAIGNAALPTVEGGCVACVSAKGPVSTIAQYPRVLEDVLRDL